MTAASVVALTASSLSPAQADEPTPPPESSPVQHSSEEQEPVLTARAAAPASSATFTMDRRSVPVAPGLRHLSFDRYDARGWVRVDALIANLSTPGLRLDYASQGKVSTRRPLTDALRRDRAVAGVNADFFDIEDTGAPLGMGVDRQRGVLHGVTEGRNLTFNVRAGNVARIAQTFLQGKIVRRHKPPIAITNLNSPTVTPGGIGVYTSVWGSVSRARVLPGAGGRTVQVVKGRVRWNKKRTATGPIKPGTIELVGVGPGAGRLKQLRKGQRIRIRYGLTDESVRVAVGGNAPLLRDGEIKAPPDPSMHPRTAIGVDEDTGKVIIVTVDGRQWHSRGLTLKETAVLMKDLGADDALNLDGGGSSTMLAREAGESTRVVNAPSDGNLRPVPNGLGFTIRSGSRRLKGFRVEPAGDYEDSHRVLLGLSRKLVARGHDEAYNPVAGAPRWRGSARVSARKARSMSTVVVGRRAGTGRVTAVSGSATGNFRVTVLGKVRRLEASTSRMSMSGRGSRRTFDLYGYDGRGFGTWIEPRDARLSYDRKKLRITRGSRGFTVTSRVASTSEVIRIRVGGRTTYIGVTVGLKRQVVHKMRGAKGWKASAYPQLSRARVYPTKDRRGRGGAATALSYRFRGGTPTKAAYLDLVEPRTLPSKARRIGMWVRGDGKGAWLRLVARDAGGTRATVNLAQRVSWRGWRFMSASLPGGLSEPVKLTRIYAVETQRKRRYKGTLAFDNVTVWSERTATVPATRPHRDSLVDDQGSLPSGGFRVAVLGDAGIRGSRPEGTAVKRTRRALREIVKAKPDLVLVNGDLVARGGSSDLALAQQLLQQELDGKVEWRYVAGDRELDGSRDLSSYRGRFGSPVRVFDRSGTRFVLLNTAHGSLRLGGFSQLVKLRSTLDAAAKASSVSSVVVVGHHPTTDPTTRGSAQLSDRREGDLVEGLLAGFRRKSGKPVTYVAGHARRFGLFRHDDVPTVFTGAVNQPARGGIGGFAGWSMLRFSGNGVRASFRPTVDALQVKSPSRLSPSGSRKAWAVLRQAGIRRGVSYPMNVRWVSSRTFHVGRYGSAPASAVAVFSPATGKISALRRGSTMVTVRVNGKTARRSLVVE